MLHDSTSEEDGGRQRWQPNVAQRNVRGSRRPAQLNSTGAFPIVCGKEQNRTEWTDPASASTSASTRVTWAGMVIRTACPYAGDESVPTNRSSYHIYHARLSIYPSTCLSVCPPDVFRSPVKEWIGYNIL